MVIYDCCFLLLMLMQLERTGAQTTLATNDLYTCGSGCKFNNVNGGDFWMIRDTDGLCSFGCCPGYLQALTAPGVYTTVTNNIAYCNNSLTWCVDGTPLYNPAAQPMEYRCMDTANGYEIGYILPGVCTYPSQYTNSTTLPACYCDPVRLQQYGRDITNAFNILKGAITCPTVLESTCQNGCGYRFRGDPLPYVLTDDGTNCEIGSANYVNIDPANNIIGCSDGSDWCYSGGTAASCGTYWCDVTTTYTPIVRGGMVGTCTSITDATPVAIDCTTYSNATTVAACTANYPTTTTSTTTTTQPPITTALQFNRCVNTCSFYLYMDTSTVAHYAITNDGTNCEMGCAIGQLYYSYDHVTWTIVPNNIIGCDPNSGATWCTAQGSTQPQTLDFMCNDTSSLSPINRGGMSACTEIADSTPILIDCSKYVDPTAKATCLEGYGSTTGINCQNGCSFTSYSGLPISVAAPYVLLDDGTNCEVACPVGQLYYSYDMQTWTEVTNNIIACDTTSNAQHVWCTAQGSTQPQGLTYKCDGAQTAYPITRGDMSSCTEIADTAPIVVDCSRYTDPNAENTCVPVYGSPSTTLSTTTASTTAAPTSALTSTTTLSTTTDAITTTASTTDGTTTTGPTTTNSGSTTTNTGTTTTGTTDGSTTTNTGTTTTNTGTTATNTGTTTTNTGTTTTNTGTTTTNTGTTTTNTGTTITNTGTSTTNTGTITTYTGTTTIPDYDTTLAAAPSGLCYPFVGADGVTYDNRCAQFDPGATCTDNGDQSSSCACSAGQTGSTCGFSTTTLQSIGPLAGPSSDPQTVLNLITESKASGTATFMQAIPSLLTFLTDALRNSLSFDVSDIIMMATFEGKDLNVAASFTSFNDPSLGNCFTFNHWNSSFKYGARMIGPRGGLVVQLDVMPEEYLPFIDTMGVNVYINEIGAHIYVESNKILSQPGGHDKIMMARTTTQLLATHKSRCSSGISTAQSYYFDGNYSIDGCYRSCYQDSCYASCGCMDPMYSRKNGTDACTLDKMQCIFDMQAKRGNPNTWPECTCYQPCHSQDYNIASYSRGLLTSKVICEQTQNFTSTLCQPRASWVTVGFLTLESMVQTEEERYPLSRALGNLGNVGGFLLGFAMVSVFELILCLIDLFCILIGKKQYAPSAGDPKKDDWR